LARGVQAAGRILSFYRGFAPISISCRAVSKGGITSSEIPPEHKRCRSDCASLRVIAFPRPHLVKVEASIKRQSGLVTGLDFKEQSFDPLRRQRRDMGAEQCAADTLAAEGRRNGDRQYLSFASNHARQDESGQRRRLSAEFSPAAAGCGRFSHDIPAGEKRFELGHAPGMREGARMDLGAGLGKLRPDATDSGSTSIWGADKTQ